MTRVSLCGKIADRDEHVVAMRSHEALATLDLLVALFGHRREQLHCELRAGVSQRGDDFQRKWGTARGNILIGGSCVRLERLNRGKPSRHDPAAELSELLIPDVEH